MSFATEVADALNEPKEHVFSLEEQNQLYALGYRFYDSGDYFNAAKFFNKLVLSNPFVGKYWFGLASSKQMQKEYLAAVHAWSLVALLQENDPMPHFHAAECLLSLNEAQDALKALNAAESLVNENQVLKNKITLLKKGLGEVNGN